MAKQKVTIKQALLAGLWDLVNVVFYAGVPATGVIVLVNLIAEDAPDVAKYSAYIATGINIVVFYVKRVLDYINGNRELPEIVK